MDFGRFADIPIIDGHIHYADPGSEGELVAFMETVPYARANLVSTARREAVNYNHALIHFKARHPGLAYISGALDYVEAHADGHQPAEVLANQVHRLVAAGFDGLKLIESKPAARKRFGIALDDPFYDVMWSALEGLGMPAVWHVADPETYWDPDLAPPGSFERGSFLGDGTFPTKEALYTEVDNVLGRHPRLKIIFAHFYFLGADLPRAKAFFEAHENVCFDLTPGFEMYEQFNRDIDAAHDFFSQHADRIIYGTDTSTRRLQAGNAQGWEHTLATAWTVRAFLETDGPFDLPGRFAERKPEDMDTFRGIGLPCETLEKIYQRNFERLYGDAPAPLAHGPAMAELDRVARELDELPDSDADENPAREVWRQLSALF